MRKPGQDRRLQPYAFHSRSRKSLFLFPVFRELMIPDQFQQPVRYSLLRIERGIRLLEDLLDHDPAFPVIRCIAGYEPYSVEQNLARIRTEYSGQQFCDR